MHSKSKIEDGILAYAKQKISHHCDARPAGSVLDLIVIHAISLPPDEFGDTYIDDLFCGCLDKNAHNYFSQIAHLKVSSHLLIRRKGEIVQFVPFQCRAWHAGQSEYQGRRACNDFSIGIELEGCDTQAFSAEQYTSLNKCITSLLDKYPHLSKQRVVGHSDISPGRKTDPGPYFEWKRIK